MKDKIVEQSVLLFEKEGFSHTSIQDIVDELGVTKGTFYYYFSSKEQLLMEIQDDYITNLLRRQEQIIHSDQMTPKDKLIGVIRLLVTDITENGPSARVYFRELRHLADENIEKIKQKRAQFRLNLEDVIRKGKDIGEFRKDLRVDMVTFGILGMTNWSYNWYQPAGEVPPEELITTYANVILTGIEG